MNASLSLELDRFVEEEVNSGHFASREAMTEAALWDMLQRRIHRRAERVPTTNWGG